MHQREQHRSTEKSPHMVCSVLIPAYNRPEYLMQCLRVLTASRRKDIEFIVSEDNSPAQELTRTKLQDIQDVRLRCFFQEKNLGWSDNRNFLIGEAGGEYLLLIGDDDILDIDRLLEYTLDRDIDADIIGIGYRTIDEDGRQTGEYRSPGHWGFNGHSWIGRRMLDFDTLPFDYFHPFTMLIKRRVFEGHIRFQRGAHTSDDLLFLIDAIRANLSFYIVDQVLFDFRVFRDQNIKANLSGDGINNLAGRLCILGNPGIFSPNRRNFIDAYLRSRDFRIYFGAIPCSIHREKILRNPDRLAAIIPAAMKVEVTEWLQRNRWMDYVRFILRKYMTRISVLVYCWKWALKRGNPEKYRSLASSGTSTKQLL